MGSLAVAVSDVPVILADKPSILEFQVAAFRELLQFVNSTIIEPRRGAWEWSSESATFRPPAEAG